MNSLIKIQDCSVQGGTKKYLDRVDWCMNAGEAWLVIGPNGGSEAPLYSSRYSDSVAAARQIL